MASKLESFLQEKKIDPRRVLSTSKEIERLRPDDRRIKLTQSQARRSEDGKVPEGLGKPRTGRPMTDVGLRRALSGDAIPGPQKTRILRAVNAILEKRKQQPVTIDALFEVPPQNPPKPKAAAEGEEAAS